MEFIFDDEIVNSQAYRRILANAMAKQKPLPDDGSGSVHFFASDDETGTEKAQQAHQSPASAGDADATDATSPASGEIVCSDPSFSEHNRSSQAAHSAAAVALHMSYPDCRIQQADAASSAAPLSKDHRTRKLFDSVVQSQAASLVSKDGGKLDLWQPSNIPTDESTASLAIRRKESRPQSTRSPTDTGRHNSLLPGIKRRSERRQRANLQDSKLDRRGARLRTPATASHRASTKTPADSSNDGKPEVDEKKHQAALGESAVSMAREPHEDQSRGEKDDFAIAESILRRSQSSSSLVEIKEEVIEGIRDGQLLDASASSDDEAQARRVHSWVEQLDTEANEHTDSGQRQADGENLLAAASNRVSAPMQDMDVKVPRERADRKKRNRDRGAGGDPFAQIVAEGKDRQRSSKSCRDTASRAKTSSNIGQKSYPSGTSISYNPTQLTTAEGTIRRITLPEIGETKAEAS